MGTHGRYALFRLIWHFHPPESAFSIQYGCNRIRAVRHTILVKYHSQQLPSWSWSSCHQQQPMKSPSFSYLSPVLKLNPVILTSSLLNIKNWFLNLLYLVCVWRPQCMRMAHTMSPNISPWEGCGLSSLLWCLITRLYTSWMMEPIKWWLL